MLSFTAYNFSYHCSHFVTIQERNYYFWNRTVSDSCCLHCDGTVYKADTVIDTIETEDECETVKTLGEYSFIAKHPQINF